MLRTYVRHLLLRGRWPLDSDPLSGRLREGFLQLPLDGLRNAEREGPPVPIELVLCREGPKAVPQSLDVDNRTDVLPRRARSVPGGDAPRLVDEQLQATNAAPVAQIEAVDAD